MMGNPYPDYMMESVKRVEATREKRRHKFYPEVSKEQRITEETAKKILNNYHPDYREDFKRKLKIGPAKGKLVPNEVANALEAYPRVNPEKVDLSQVDYSADVLVIGTGGAGLSAVLWANNQGIKMEDILVSTKLRLGDSNSKMSQGGIQAADKEDDSPMIHWLDVMSGGHWTNEPELAEDLVMDGPLVIKWLEELGAEFDKEADGEMMTRRPGGASRMRLHSCKDYTGLELTRVLMDEAQSRGINTLEFCPAVSLLTDSNGAVSGALLWNMETEEYHVVRAKSTLLATGGFGRLHVGGFPTTNHYGATFDGVVSAYRVGANLQHLEYSQYHPTGAAYPEQIVGLLVTEKCRSMHAQLVNDEGDAFIYPLETRDVEAAAEIREYKQGRGIETPTGQPGIWLDTPLIDEIHGRGALEENLAAIYRLFTRFDIDPTKYPVLVWPTLHYQNGGVAINDQTQVLDINDTPIGNLFAAGETTGGVHGDNRLMGNSWLEIVVYGRKAGISAARHAKNVKMPAKEELSLAHLNRYSQKLQDAGIKTDRQTPVILPNYLDENAMKTIGYGEEEPLKRRLDLFH